MAKLLLFLQDGSSKEILFDKDRITIGRRSDNDVPLPYPAVSGRHAVISFLPPEKCFIEDLKSTNGTLLNGHLLTERKQLKDRDQVDIGGQKFVYLEGKTRAIATATSPPLSLADKNTKVPRKPATMSSAHDAPDFGLSPAHGYLNAGGTSPMTAHTEAPSPTTEVMDDEEYSGLHFPTIFKTAAANRVKNQKKTEPSPLPALDTSLVKATQDELEEENENLFEETSVSMPSPIAVIEALSGPNNHRRLLLRPGEYVLGRPGLQLAVVQVRSNECRLLPMEGEPPLELRGETVPPDGMLLEDNDRFTVGHSPLQFRLLSQQSSMNSTPDSSLDENVASVER
ncbi:MAG: FHA domain-containing protein [Burkholderiales bacterium]|jgi:pSer/pThr/pTyr-binding forkhead associated (FHA) protein|nr:FHA domain-containing protein [Burkholderiales bacterium]